MDLQEIINKLESLQKYNSYAHCYAECSGHSEYEPEENGEVIMTYHLEEIINELKAKL